MSTIDLAIKGDLSEKQVTAIELISSGMGYEETARQIGVSSSTIRSWRSKPNFRRVLNEQILQSGPAQKAERIRIGQLAVAQKVNELNGTVDTRADLLDWMKYLAQETGQWYSNSEVADLQRKLKLYETLMYLMKYEACDKCKTLVAHRMMEMSDDQTEPQ